MENFNPQTIDLATINNGTRFKAGDIPSAEVFNAPIEAAAWAQKIAKETQDLVKLAIGKDYEEIVAAIEVAVNNKAHPPKSLWFTESDDDPAEIFGGFWEKIVDRVIVGAGGKYSVGSTGGSADAVVVSHTHKFNTLAGSAGSGYSQPTATSSYSQTFTSAVTQSAGESGTEKNMMPYRAFYIWYRYA